MDNMKDVVENLKWIRQDRLRARRLLFKFLRENKEYLPNYCKDRVQRKMRFNYMGDLTDNQIIEYSTYIINNNRRLET